ncbi:retrotransposon protein, putative, unclassified [Tanacetum coccineum]|uniref:Retrotransposon protein, putative, unclassified n=1 Tax=Tanacetum coccineum TaxID=301880 RepID=A0ABQ5G7U0_9ASTR
MTTLAEHIIVAGAKNRPSMLEKSMYDSWASCIRLFIKGKKHGRMMLDSIDNGPLVYPTVEENRQTRPMKYSKLTEAQQLQDECDQGEDLIECINKAMEFLYVVASRIPPSNNQLQTSSNPRNQATIQDGKVIIQQVQVRQSWSFAGTRNRGIATTLRGNYAAGQPRVMKCYNCQGEGHMARQCTQPKRPRNVAWFKEKLICSSCSADNPFDSDCDDLSSTKAILIANLSSCDLDDVQEIQYSKQTRIDDFQDNEIHSDSNIIPYYQYLQESQDVVIQDTNSSAPNDLLVLSLVEQMTDHVAHLDKENQTNKMVNESLTVELERYKERVAIFEQRHNVDLNKREKLIDSQIDDLIRNRNAKLAAFQQEIDKLKETLSNHVKEKESLSKTLSVFKTKSKEKVSKYIDKEIVLEKQNKKLENIICKKYRQAMHMLTKPQVFYNDTHKQALGYQNPFNLKKAQRIQPTLYDGSGIAKEHDVIYIKEDFGKRFVTQKELSAEQAFWLKHSPIFETHVKSHTPVRIEAPSELSKVSLVNESLKKLKYQLANFDKVVEKRTTSDAITAEKDTVIRKLKDKIKSLSGKDNVGNVKKDIDGIETINIELEHSVTQLLSENENFRKEQKHLKSIYKDQFDSIRRTPPPRFFLVVQSKERCDSLIAQINAKSVEISDLNAQLQEKVFAIATLKNELKKLKGKNTVDTTVSKPSATIASGMFKLDIKAISHKLKKQ